MNQGIFDKIIIKIKWLRTQPENVKVRYIWVSAFVVFAIVAVLWVGLFRKYERKPADNGKNAELIKEGEKLKKELEDKIKFPEVNLPEKEKPSVSPEVSPIIPPEISPTVSPELSPEVL